jgi:hypothetical protein
VREDHDVAQRQHRIGSGFTWRKRWAWICSGHGPASVLLSLSAATRCAQPRQSTDGPGEEYGPPQRYPRPNGRYDTLCPFSRPARRLHSQLRHRETAPYQRNAPIPRGFERTSHFASRRIRTSASQALNSPRLSARGGRSRTCASRLKVVVPHLIAKQVSGDDRDPRV